MDNFAAARLIALLRLHVAADNAAMQTEPPKAEPPKRKRRWFQFSLRTLLIVVAVLAVLCGYVARQADMVRERKAILKRVLADRRFFVGPAIEVCDDGSLNRSIRRLRWMMSDTWIDLIGVSPRIAADEFERLRAAFPEPRIERDDRQ